MAFFLSNICFIINHFIFKTFILLFSHCFQEHHTKKTRHNLNFEKLFFWHIYCNTINCCLPDLRFSNQQVLFIWLTFPTYGSKKKNNRGPLNWQILLEQTILSLLCLITNINLVHLVMMAYKCSINELHMQTLSTTYNWPSSLKAKPSTSNSKAPLMNLEYQNNNS